MFPSGFLEKDRAMQANKKTTFNEIEILNSEMQRRKFWNRLFFTLQILCPVWDIICNSDSIVLFFISCFPLRKAGTCGNTARTKICLVWDTLKIIFLWSIYDSLLNWLSCGGKDEEKRKLREMQKRFLSCYKQSQWTWSLDGNWQIHIK